MFHPWRRLRALGHVRLSWRVMPGRLGQTNGLDEIELHPHQLQVQRRCTLAHELAHIELGHVGGCSGVEERVARELAARWLIEVDDLVDAALWARSLEELADELWVDVDTLEARLSTIKGDERRLLVGAWAAIDAGC